MTNVGEENNAKMECVFQLEDAIHRVVQERNVIIIIKFVFLIAQEMTNVGEENNAKMECVFLLKDAFHHVEMEEYAGKEYVFLHALIIHNVDLDSDVIIKYVFPCRCCRALSGEMLFFKGLPAH